MDPATTPIIIKVGEESKYLSALSPINNPARIIKASSVPIKINFSHKAFFFNYLIPKLSKPSISLEIV